MHPIVLVEDEELLLEIYARILAPLGREIRTARTCAEGLRHLDHQAALVITDMRLPDGDGLTIVKRARTLGLPVIVVTGSDPARAEVSGADRAFVKPFSAAALRTAARDLLP